MIKMFKVEYVMEAIHTFRDNKYVGVKPSTISGWLNGTLG